MPRRVAVALLGLLPLPAAAEAIATPPAPVEAATRARAEAGVAAGLDDNALRSSEAAERDGFLQLRGLAEVALPDAPLGASATFSFGDRRYFTLPEADERALQGSLAVGAADERVAIALEGGASSRVQRAGLRDSSERSGRLSASLAATDALELALQLGARDFTWGADPALSFTGPSLGASAGLALSSRLVAELGLEASLRSFPDGRAYRDDGALVGARRDRALSARLGAQLRGPLRAGLGVSAARDRSNGVGLSTDLLRLDGSLAARLPLGLAGAAQATLQWVSFPDGISDGRTRLVEQEDEGLSGLSLRLSRPLTAHLDAELSGQSTFALLVDGGERYGRLTGLVGLRARFGAE